MRQKRARFEQNKHASNLIEPGKNVYKTIRGKWGNFYFLNDHPITIEVGCGRGEYTIGLAKKFPQRNFIGIDIKGDRLWVGSQQAEEDTLRNVAFLRIRLEQLADFFEPGEVDEIWITFPGPRPKKSEANRRLTNDRFLDLYKQIIAPGGIVRLKTDSDLVYSYTLDRIKKRNDITLLKKTPDLYGSSMLSEHFDIQTYFERKFLSRGAQIKYLTFRFKRPTIFDLTKDRISSTIRALFRRVKSWKNQES